MNWLSIPISALRDPRYIFLDPKDRAEWFERILHCVESDLSGEAAGIRHGAEIFTASARVSAREGIGNYRTRRYRRMKAARAIATHTEEEWLALLASFGGFCLACGATKSIQKDHIRAVVNGGSDGLENLQPLCRSCNSSKKDKTIDYRRAR